MNIYSRIRLSEGRARSQRKPLRWDFAHFFEQNDRITFYKLKIGRNDNPAGTRRNGSHPLPSIARPPDLVVRLVTEGGRYPAFPPPKGIQLFPIGILMQSTTAQFHFRKDVTQNFLDTVNVVVTEHPERKAEIKILIGKERKPALSLMTWHFSRPSYFSGPLSHIVKIHDVDHIRWHALKRSSRPRTATSADFQHDRVLRYINPFGKHPPVGEVAAVV